MSSPTSASAKAVESAEQTINTARQIRNYSQSLRQSSAMQKYLQSSDGGNTRDPKVRVENNIDNSDAYFETQKRPATEQGYKLNRAISFAPVVTTHQPQVSQDESFTPKKITNTVLSRKAYQETNEFESQDERSDNLFDAKEAQRKFTRENTAASADVSKDAIGSTALFRARLLSK
jgi:hypothetical protein